MRHANGQWRAGKAGCRSKRQRALSVNAMTGALLLEWAWLHRGRVLSGAGRTCTEVGLRNCCVPCRMLSLQLATLEAQNKEVAGDDDADEEDEGMGQLDVDAPALQVN